MHRLKSPASIYRFRVAAVLLCLRWLMLPAIFVVLMLALATWNQPLAMSAVTLTVITLVVSILQWLLALRTGCPLCLTPVLARKSCVRHRKARTLFVNYRLRVALGIIFTNSFDCPYCSESTVLEVRAKSPRN